MKIIKKLILSLFTANILFLGFGFNAHASENDVRYNKQRDQLVYAVADRSNVVTSEAYYSYASEDTKASYEKAIADGDKLVQMGSAASIKDLAQATANINKAKANIKKEVDKELKKKKLEGAVDTNRKTVEAAKYLLKNVPHTVASVKGKLLQLIQKSENLINKTELILQNM